MDIVSRVLIFGVACFFLGLLVGGGSSREDLERAGARIYKLQQELDKTQAREAHSPR